MKKYVVKYKDSEKVFGWYSSRVEASFKVVEYINDFNDGLEGDYVSPFDFTLEEVECKDVNEVITDFESAKRYLNQEKGLRPNTPLVRSTSVCVMRQRFFEDIDDKHLEALVALNQLLTIAEAWNKADGFVPDFSNWNQAKWYPWFGYNKDAAKFACTGSLNAPSTAHASSGSRLCFKTEERAEQFGKQFIELYNKVFLTNK